MGKGSNVGKYSVWDANVWSRGVVVAGLVAVSACGSRSQLKGTNGTDDDGTVAGSGGQGNSGGIVTAQAASTVAGVSVVTGPSSAAITTGSIPNTTFGVTSTTGVTTGVGGAPPCLEPFEPPNLGGYGGEGGAPSDVEMCPIPFCNGWAHKDANCAEIQGSFFFYDDQYSGGSSYITSNTDNQRVCVLGQVNEVIDGQYGVYWGAGFGMHLNQPGFGYYPEIYDAEQHGVTGFGFSVDALPVGGELRFIVRGDDVYCTSVINTGYAQYSLADLTKGCWDPVSTPHDYSRLTSIEWHFVSNGSNAYDFDVCVSDLTVYRRPNE